MQDIVRRKRQRMVRKQVFITADQNRRLKASAALARRSEGEIVREAVEQWLGTQKADEEDWKAGLLSLAGMWVDYPEIEAKINAGRKSWARRRASQKR